MTDPEYNQEAIEIGRDLNRRFQEEIDDLSKALEAALKAPIECCGLGPLILVPDEKADRKDGDEVKQDNAT